MRNHLFFSSHFLRCCMCVWKFCYFPNNQRDDFKFRIHAASSNPQNINKRENNNFPTTTTNNSWNIRKTFCGWWWWRRKGENEVKQNQFVVDEKWFCVFMQLKWKRFENLSLDDKEPLLSVTVAFQCITQKKKSINSAVEK